jgi:Putative DNA-binding domain
MRLETMQRRMMAAVMLPLTAEDSMQERNEAGEPMAAVAAEFVAPNDRLTAFERLEIYNRQYWFRLLNALAEDFPGVRAVVGPERFDRLAVEYLKAHPSRSFTLRDLGHALADWLRANPTMAGRSAGAAADVAALEWASVEAFDNGELTPLTSEEIGRLGLESKLVLQPHLRLLALKHGADALVLELSRQERERAREAGSRHSVEAAAKVRVARERMWLAVHRVENQVYYRRLAREEFQTLAALEAGKSLGQALEAGFFRSRIPMAERPKLAGEWFQHWAQLGWLCETSTDFEQERQAK